MGPWGLLLLAPWLACAEQLIQIGIAPNASEITVRCKSACSAVDSEGRGLELSPGRDYVLEAADEGLRVGPLAMSDAVRVRPGRSGDFWVGKARYRGVLAVKRNADGTVTAVDELGIEDYLLGVLPHEMDPGWPLESLKAQAVVARTFAYTQLGKYRKSGFDLTSDTRSQVFSGTADPAPSILKAVRETRGEVLGYKGKILAVYYHACCGGHTADAASVWGGASSRPLSGVRDRWCKDSPYANWEAYFPEKDIRDALAQRELSGGPLRRLRLGRPDRAGFIHEILLDLAGETIKVKAAEFRSWIGNTVLKSTRLSAVRRLAKGFEFTGSGSGHGVGLCQWGARLQAEKGRDYEEILRFYFPGAVLSEIDE